MKFTKMEGLGNDYVYINCFSEKVENPEKLAIAMSDRHFGVGSDGVILIKPSDKADFTMDMYNADGSRSEMCGNGIRMYMIMDLRIRLRYLQRHLPESNIWIL